MSWIGRFASANLPLVASGLIRIDTNLKPGQRPKGTIRAKAAVTYTGLFRNGRTIAIDVTVTDDLMQIDLDGRIIDFRIETQTETDIWGIYQVQGNIDRGQFVLVPQGSRLPDMPSSGCTVM